MVTHLKLVYIGCNQVVVMHTVEQGCTLLKGAVLPSGPLGMTGTDIAQE